MHSTTKKATRIITLTDKPKPTPAELKARAQAKLDKAEAKRALIATEDGPARLRRLGQDRVKKACNSIRLIGNLAAYKPTEEQIDKIMEALGASCAAVDARMRGQRSSAVDFKL